MASILLRERVALRKLIWVGPLTIVATTIVNLIIRTIAVASFGVAETFQSLQAGSVIGSSIVFVLLALLALWLVNRFTKLETRMPPCFNRGMKGLPGQGCINGPAVLYSALERLY